MGIWLMDGWSILKQVTDSMVHIFIKKSCGRAGQLGYCFNAHVACQRARIQATALLPLPASH